MFVAFRREIVINQSKDDDDQFNADEDRQNWQNYRIDVPKIIKISEYKVDLNDLINVYNILQQTGETLSKENLKKCDAVVKKLGLDKRRSEYFNYSRTLALQS